MAIDPKQLAAFAGVDAPAKGGKPAPVAPAAAPAKPAPHPDLPEDEPESDEEAMAEGTLETEFPKLYPLLEEYGDEFEAVADSLDPALLADENADISEDEETLGLFLSGLDALPDDLQDAMVEEGPHMEWDKAAEIADALEAGGHISNPEVVTGLLFHFGQLFDEAAPSAEEVNAEDGAGDMGDEDAEPESPDDEPLPA
jgi:hypothetical protein